MLRLITFGGAAIISDTGAPVPGAATQRRTLALLSALAVAGRVGMSRDKLVALFWPETDSERGRHALTQALYAARRGLRCDDLFVVSADVRLNAERISADVADFEIAVDAEPQAALTLYRGPFLDGFFLPGSAEFEQWASAQRARLEAEALRAVERLAESATESGDHREAAVWWKRAAALRPLDSGITVRLMNALVAAGDRAGAVQCASVHAALLRAELDIDADPAVTALAEQLRQAVPPAASPLPLPTTSVIEAVEEPAHTDVGDSVTPVAASQPIPVRAVEVWTPPRRRARVPRIAALVTFVLVLLLGFVLGRGHRSTPQIGPLPQRQRVVVAPFRIAGAAASLGYLRDGIVELLSTRLADDSTARSVDAGAVIGAWRAAGLAPAVDVSRDTVVHLAARLGAERVVVGGIVGTPSWLVVRATVLRVPDGAVTGQASVEGSADSITSVVDRLAVKLLVAEAGEEEQLARHTTTSLTALKAYLAGQSALRRGDYSLAIHRFDAALERDSTFALAGLRLAVAADRVDDALRFQNGVRTAWLYRQELSERDAAMLRGFVGPRFPAPSLASEQADAWAEAAALAPNSADAWFALGTRLVHDGADAGLTNAPAHARDALERALAADAAFAPAADLLAHLAISARDGWHPSARATMLALADSLNPLAPFLRWRHAVMMGSEAELRVARAALPRLGPVNLRKIAMVSQVDAAGLRDGARALALLDGRGPFPRSDEPLARHSLALNEGRVNDALAATRDLRHSVPESHADVRLRVLDMLYGDGDTAEGQDAARALEQLARVAADSEPATSVGVADLCVLGQWWLALRRVGDVARVAADLRRSALPRTVTPVGVAPLGCAELLDAGIAVARGQRDARARLAHIDSLALTTAAVGDAVAYAPLWIARMHERLGDVAGALAALRRREYMVTWPRYQASMLREEGRLAQRAGDVDTARGAYARYLALRDHPDSSLVAQADSVRRSSEELSASSGR